MDWFKYPVNYSKKEFIIELEQEFSSAGFSAWIKLLELCLETDHCILSISVENLCKSIGLEKKELLPFLDFALIKSCLIYDIQTLNCEAIVTVLLDQNSQNVPSRAYRRARSLEESIKDSNIKLLKERKKEKIRFLERKGVWGKGNLLENSEKNDVKFFGHKKNNSGREINPKTEIKKPELNSKTLDLDFEAWWKIYPRKIGKFAAKKSFTKAVTILGIPELMLAVENFSRSVLGQEKEFIPHASTWLNQRRWEDWLEPVNDGDPSIPAGFCAPLVSPFGFE